MKMTKPHQFQFLVDFSSRYFLYRYEFIINTYETEKETNILLKKINDYAYSLRDDFLWFDDIRKNITESKIKRGF